MRFFLFLVLNIVSLSASNLLYLEEDYNGGVKTYCIDDDYYYKNNTMYFYDLRVDYERTINTKAYQKIVVIAGWTLDQYKNCIFEESNYYGLSYEEYHYLMALFGVVLSLLIGFGLIVSVV